MTTFLARSAALKAPPTKELTPMASSEVLGFALHWPGTTSPIGPATASSIGRRLEAYRRMHTDTTSVKHGWSDIGYQMAIDQAGRVWALRGIRYRSAANGDATTNRRYGAVLLMVGPGEEPTKAMVQAIRDFRVQQWLKMYPTARTIVGHQSIRPQGTECPGPKVMDLLGSNVLTLPGTTSSVAHYAPRPRLLGDLPNVAVSGVWDRDTTRLVQRFLNASGIKPKLDDDGINGPQSKKNLQKWLGFTGADVDGAFEKKSWARLQSRLGVPITGRSNMRTVIAWQKYLNRA